MQLPWVHQFQFAGYYAAHEQGYYKDAGLNVTLVQGKPGLTSIDEVSNGNAEYGVCRSEIMAKRMQGVPVILCTGYTSAITEGEAYAAGIKKFVTKPINKRKFAEFVRQVLDENGGATNRKAAKGTG